MSRYTRREFIQTTGLVVGSLITQKSVFGRVKPQAKPNVLVIMSDEHNASVLGCYDNDIVRTPNLDGLARKGIAFDSCYCNSPLCVPSRLSFTSGKYASRVSAWSNSCWLPSPDYPSLARAMNAAGYESVLCGKMHYDKTRRYGFREIGNMNNSNKTGRGGRRRADDLKPKPGISNRFDNFHTAENSSVMAHDKKVTTGTVEFLKNRRASDKPFFMITGYLAPHFPLIVPEKYRQRYLDKVPMPKIPEGHLKSQPLNYKHLRIGFNIENVPDEIVHKGRELYYGLTQWVDEEVGKVLDCLADSEVADNTVVIYTADHGENMGEHGLWWKNCMYEHAARVPLIVSWPARWKGGQRRIQACSLVDVVQTITELGGAEVPLDWNGDSMIEWIDNPDTRWKDLAVSEYYAHNIASGFAMIRKGMYKYVYHTPADASHPAERQLFDMQSDPGEFNNLAGRDEFKDRVNSLHEALIKEIGEHPDRTEQRCRTEYSKGYVQRRKKNTQSKT
jgi:choline-sulfatase